MRTMTIWVLALVAIPSTLACEVEVPASDPSSSSDWGVGTSASEGSPPVVRRARLTPAKAKAARTTSQDDSPPTATIASPDRQDERPPLRAFVAGGESRFLCPSGYRAQAADGTCACVSSADQSRYPMADAPCGDGTPRAEGSECIFTCVTGE